MAVYERGLWNRGGRRSGGYKKVRIVVPRLTKDDLKILEQEAAIRAEFGEDGVRRFWEELEDADGR